MPLDSSIDRVPTPASWLLTPPMVCTSQPPMACSIAGEWKSRVMSAWYPNAGIDVVRGNKLTINGSGITLANGKLNCTGSTSGSDYADLGVFTSPANIRQFSSISIVTPRTLTNRASMYVIGGSATERGYMFGSGWTDGQYITGWNPNSNKNTSQAIAGHFVSGVRGVYGVSSNHDTKAVRYYKNQAYVGGDSWDFSNDIWYTVGDSLLCPGGRYSGAGSTVGWDGSIELQVFFPVLLSDAELISLTTNPWQLFSSVY